MNPTFNYYPADVKQTRPIGTIDLETFISKIKNPKSGIKHKLDRIRNTTDTTEKDQLKKQLYYFTPAVGPMLLRNYESIQNFTGLAVLDFDKVPAEVNDIKKFLFLSYNCVVASWFSSSYKGVRALVKIPVVSSVDEYKQLFHGIRQEVSFRFPGFDKAPQNPVLPLFMSYDPEILYRPYARAETWTKVEVPPQPIYKPVPLPNFYKDSDRDKSHVINIVKRKIADIGPPGHTQLRSISYAAGGYVASGIISESELLDVIEYCITQNNYLGQRHKVAGYIRTAREMVSNGKLEPLLLNS
jgi:hypothetical protein